MEFTSLQGEVTAILRPLIYKHLVPYIANCIEQWGEAGFQHAVQNKLSLLERFRERDPRRWRQLQRAKRYFTPDVWDQDKLEQQLFALLKQKGIRVSSKGWAYIQYQLQLFKEELMRKG